MRMELGVDGPASACDRRQGPAWTRGHSRLQTATACEYFCLLRPRSWPSSVPPPQRSGSTVFPQPPSLSFLFTTSLSFIQSFKEWPDSPFWSFIFPTTAIRSLSLSLLHPSSFSSLLLLFPLIVWHVYRSWLRRSSASVSLHLDCPRVAVSLGSLKLALRSGKESPLPTCLALHCTVHRLSIPIYTHINIVWIDHLDAAYLFHAPTLSPSLLPVSFLPFTSLHFTPRSTQVVPLLFSSLLPSLLASSLSFLPSSVGYLHTTHH